MCDLTAVLRFLTAPSYRHLKLAAVFQQGERVDTTKCEDVKEFTYDFSYWSFDPQQPVFHSQEEVRRGNHGNVCGYNTLSLSSATHAWLAVFGHCERVL